jgi:opacity protein-like surface antigen
LKDSNYQSESTKSNLALEAQYAAAFGDKFVLAGGVNLGAGDLSFGDPSYGEVKLKETASVFLKPGYALSDSTVVFVKLAALRGKASLGSQSDNISGNGYGLGVQVRSGKNVFYQVEWNQNRYNDLSTPIGGRNGLERLSSNALTFGVGYKF